MAIKKRNETYSVSWVSLQDTKNKLNKKIAIQRGEKWSTEKKSNFIISILRDIPIENLLFEQACDGTYLILDGLQRTITICAFVKGGFALSSKIKVKEVDGKNLVGLKFNDLSPAMQEKIMDFQLSITILEEVDTETRAEIFWARNQGVALTNMDLSPVTLGEDIMERFTEFCQHPFIKNVVNLSDTALRRRDDLKIILQYMILCSGEDIGFDGKAILNFCSSVKNGDKLIKAEEITPVMDYLIDVLPVRKAFITKIVNIPIIMYIAKQAIETGMSADVFGEKLSNFFANVPEEYNMAKMSGSAKRVQVQTRLNILRKYVFGE